MKIPVVLFRGDERWRFLGEYFPRDLPALVELLSKEIILDGEDGPGWVAYSSALDLMGSVPRLNIYLKHKLIMEV